MAKGKNMLIAQSGGPTAAINATLAGAVKEAMQYSEIEKIYGARNGIAGLLEEKIIDLRAHLKTQADFDRLVATPAMALGSCRVRLDEESYAVYQRIAEVFHKWEIGYFFYIGGNDSMDTVQKLTDYFKSAGEDITVIGIPKTIDNDLNCTDHTPGFGSAARYIATSVAEIFTDSEIYVPDSMTVIEIMGRNAGWLTAASALARRAGCPAPHMICMPEVPFDMEKFLARAEALSKQHSHVIIAVSEGVRRSDGSYLASDNMLDPFGHQQLSGVGQHLGQLLKVRFGTKVRAIEFNVLQRAAAHIQSETDIEESLNIGAHGVKLAMAGETGVMAVFERLSDKPYEVKYGAVDVHRVANRERTVPVEWIDADKMDIRQELVDYLTPLIRCPSQKEPGIPEHFVF